MYTERPQVTRRSLQHDSAQIQASLGVKLFLLSAPGISWGTSQAVSQNEGLGEGFPAEERCPLGDAAAVDPHLTKSQSTLLEGVWGPGWQPWALGCDTSRG